MVTINQLVLSQELGAVGKQQSRMQDAMKFRQDIENHLDKDVSSPEPAAFSYELIKEIEAQANNLTDSRYPKNEKLTAKLEDYSSYLTQNAQSVSEELEDAQFGTFEVIWAILNFNYSEKINQARQIQTEHEKELSEKDNQTINELINLLTFFGPTREHFKTLYFQWELIKLSRALLYTSIFSLTTIGLLLMHINTTTVSGTTAGIDNLVILTSLGFTVGIAPFIIFTTFLLRIATVAKRTLAMGPFILRENN